MTLASHGNANNPEGKARRTAFRRLEEMRQLTLAGMAVRTPHPPQKATQRYPNFAFGPDDTRILIETPEKTFADMWGTGAPLRPAERSINCLPGTWWRGLVRSSCCAKASIRWRWRRHNCRMEPPISHHPATRCTLSDRADSPKISGSPAGP
jgi:hypothetical protein